MTTSNKVVWCEGMFLRPQHFQQQDRYFEQLLLARVSGLAPYQWGFEALEIDNQMLKLGKVTINRCKALMPDGTTIHIPEVDESISRDVEANTRNQILYLAIPLRKNSTIDIQTQETFQGITRYISSEQRIVDVVTGEEDEGAIAVARLQIKLLLESEDRSGYVTLGMLRIKERAEDKTISLDPSYIPPLLNIRCHDELQAFLKEFPALISHRAEALAGRIKDGAKSASAEIHDFLLLQLLNRIQPTAEIFLDSCMLHPYDMYVELMKISGELATFTSPTRRPEKHPGYLHDELSEVFPPLLSSVKRFLSTVLEQSAIALELKERKYGIRVSPITDRKLLETAVFVLAVKADVNADKLRTGFPAQLKIGPVEQIRELINAQLPGISVSALPAAPRQIPYQAGFTYFQLDENNDYWRAMRSSGGFAVHISGDFPGLALEFWAIRRNA